MVDRYSKPPIKRLIRKCHRYAFRWIMCTYLCAPCLGLMSGTYSWDMVLPRLYGYKRGPSMLKCRRMEDAMELPSHMAPKRAVKKMAERNMKPVGNGV